jgi:hypothetical protein
MLRCFVLTCLVLLALPARGQASSEREVAALRDCAISAPGASVAACVASLRGACEGAACDLQSTAMVDQLARGLYREIEARLERADQRELRIAQVNSELVRKHACGLEADLSPAERRERVEAACFLRHAAARAQDIVLVRRALALQQKR